MSRNNGVPPAPPTLIVAKATHSIISLSWTPPPVDGGAPITAYRLHHHRWTLKMDFYLKDYLFLIKINHLKKLHILTCHYPIAGSLVIGTD